MPGETETAGLIESAARAATTIGALTLDVGVILRTKK